MIPEKTKALFQLIDYLHSNIDNFNQYDGQVSEIMGLIDESAKFLLTPKDDRDEEGTLRNKFVQSKIAEKQMIIKTNIIQKINAKAESLQICDLNHFETLWNWNTSAATFLEEEFSKEDLPVIYQHKRKYIEFRTLSKWTDLHFDFFHNLDDILVKVFSIFKKDTGIRFEGFNNKNSQGNEHEVKDNQPARAINKIYLDWNEYINNYQNDLKEYCDHARTPTEYAFILDMTKAYEEALNYPHDYACYIVDNENGFNAKNEGSEHSTNAVVISRPGLITEAEHDLSILFNAILKDLKEKLEQPGSMEAKALENEPKPKPHQTLSDLITHQNSAAIVDEKNEIEEAFAFMLTLDPRKHKQILKDSDYEKLIQWVKFYFENDFRPPEIAEPIREINTAKGNVIYTFMKLFKEIHPTMRRPDSLFLLIRQCFFQYRDDSLENLSKIKKPQYYDELLKNS